MWGVHYRVIGISVKGPNRVACAEKLHFRGNRRSPQLCDLDRKHGRLLCVPLKF